MASICHSKAEPASPETRPHGCGVADSAYVANAISQISGPLPAIGHSYRGAVIANAATGLDNVVGFVYVAALDEGEVLGGHQSWLDGQCPELRSVQLQ